MAATSACVDGLPPEIVSQIFDHLSTRAPSEVLLHEQPREDMFLSTSNSSSSHSENGLQRPERSADLKSVSRVSKRWRTLALPSLFRHVLWQPKVTSLSVFDLQPIPLLQFLLSNSLDHYVTTFTLLVDYSETEIYPADFPRQMRTADLEWLWDRLFSVIDPSRFTIIAPPSTLAAFLNRMLFLDDAWSFDIPYHILSLARPGRKAKTPGCSLVPTRGLPLSASLSPELVKSDAALTEATNAKIETMRSSQPSRANAPAERHRPCKTTDAPTSPLFILRPWTSILLNEGSSIRAYQTYEFFLRQPPSMLSALLGIGEYPNNQPLLPSTITDFNYIAIFPLASHVQTLLSDLPKLDRLFVQLTPRPTNQVLQDQKAMKNIDMADLWMERNTAYSHLFAELTQAEPHNNWASLKVFESGDAADKESWNMALDFLKRSGINNWIAERDGVLVKVDEAGNPEQSASTAEHHLLREESLNGSLLSVAPSLLYAHHISG
ncbi:hypothetical protein JX266_011737 [Neoarthrinium moseri]|nr:hypothetical protein JX266_011737 [Neoarthrinium moseri]